MPKNEKVKVNVKERVDDNVCDLSLSELTEVPVREIVSFKRVTALDLSSNNLITLGKNFISLTRLVKLDLSKNQIKYLPDDFGVLRNLRHLDLYDNKLEHLPLSFGNLTNLRYLDLKGNPLTPALAKIVGLCLTNKECQDSARNTVKFLARMQAEAEKAKEQAKQEAMNANAANQNEEESTEEKSAENNKQNKKAANKKPKYKLKKVNVNGRGSTNEKKVINDIPADLIAKINEKVAKTKKRANQGPSVTALTSIITFFILLTVNVAIIYTIMFKNPEVAEQLVSFIPPHYRDWIVTKAEFFRLSVTDWITYYITPPEEN